MKSGICPKCGSDEIYENPERIANPAGWGSLLIKYKWYSVGYVELNELVCTNCGYVETYVADKKFLPDIRKHWKPFNKAKRKSEG